MEVRKTPERVISDELLKRGRFVWDSIARYGAMPSCVRARIGQLLESSKVSILSRKEVDRIRESGLTYVSFIKDEDGYAKNRSEDDKGGVGIPSGILLEGEDSKVLTIVENSSESYDPNCLLYSIASSGSSTIEVGVTALSKGYEIKFYHAVGQISSKVPAPTKGYV